MKQLLLIIMMCFVGFIYAQDTAQIKIITLDSLKKYHIGIAKTDSNKIQLAKTNFVPWSKMSVSEKGEYIVKTIIYEYREKYPILFWLVVAVLAIWFFKQAGKIMNKIKTR
jgi:hypothetical protein